MNNIRNNMSTLPEQSIQNPISLLKMIENLSIIENDGDTDLFDEETQKIQKVIQQKKFNKDEITESGHTILMVLIEAQNTELALELIKSGMSNPGMVTSDNDTALILACYNGLNTVASELIKTGESKPEIQNKNLNTALLYACYNGMEDVVFALIETGNSNPGIKNDENETALTTACANAYKDISLKLLETGQSNPGVVNNEGDTALNLACYSNMPEVALKIIETGESNPGIINSHESTALINACSYGLSEVITELLKLEKQSAGSINISQIDESGNTALLHACDKALKDVSLELIKTGQSNPSQINNQGRTALFYACKTAMPEVALELIKTGNSNPGVVENGGFTALIAACVSKLSEVALELIKTGQSNPGVDINGTTALIIACSNKQTEVAIALIQTGLSNPESTTAMHGQTALDIAIKNNMEEIVKLLKDEQAKYIIDINNQGYNFITMETVTIKQYINESIFNICFKIGEHYFFTTKNGLERQLNDEANIKYGCVKAGYNDPPNDPYDYFADTNIIYDKQYLSLSSVFGLQIFVEKDEIDMIVTNPFSTQLYNLISTGVKLASIMSDAFINGRYGSSADHCQPGKETEVYTIIPGTGTCITEEPQTEEPQNEEPQTEENANTTINIKIQYKGHIYQFQVDDTSITIGELKQKLLDKLLEDKYITSINQNVRFIYKAKIFTQDEIELNEIEIDPNGITLQSMLNPIQTNGGKKINKKRTKKLIIKRRLTKRQKNKRNINKKRPSKKHQSKKQITKKRY